MNKRWVFLMCIFTNFSLIAQRSFLLQVSSTSRSYLLTSSNSIDTPNQPLVIVLHTEQGLYSTFVNEASWKSITKPVIVTFPRATSAGWNCDKLSNDSLFLAMLIQELHIQFRINQNKILILGTQNTQCLLTQVKSSTANKNINIYQLPFYSGNEGIINAIKDWIKNNPGMEKDIPKPKKNRIDSILTAGFTSLDSFKLHSWHKRKTLSISTGGFYFLSNALAPTDYKTYINVANSRSFISFQYTSWGSDSLAFFLDVGLLSIPQNQDINLAGGTASVTVGGGILTTYVAGFKYAFYRHKMRPYIGFGAGPMSMIIFGGKFEASNISSFSTVDGGPPPSSSSLKMASRINTIAILESGMDLRIGKRIYTSFNIRYSHSGKFENAGGINSIRAMGINMAMGLIIGTNKEYINHRPY